MNSIYSSVEVLSGRGKKKKEKKAIPKTLTSLYITHTSLAARLSHLLFIFLSMSKPAYTIFVSPNALAQRER